MQQPFIIYFQIMKILNKLLINYVNKYILISFYN